VATKGKTFTFESGKTTLLQVLSDGTPAETAPTIGLNVKMVKRGGVQMKCWDLGGDLYHRKHTCV
jgi:ADP-ribosylation factor-like protein 8